MKKPFGHALRKHHLPAMRTALLGIFLAVLVLVAAFGCPARGMALTACGASIILIVVLLLLFIPRRIRHIWHTIEHLDLLYYTLAFAIAVSIFVLMPASGIIRAVIAVVVFLALVAIKLV